jgi:hypothetical protein
MKVSSSHGSPIATPWNVSVTASTVSSNRLFSTYSRVAAVQSCPVLKQAPTIAASARASRSASSNTMNGALPPNSRCTRLSVSAAVFITFLPVPVEPVTEIMRRSGCSTSAWPVSLPPVTTLSTPGGRPASLASSPSMSAVRGVPGAGFKTVVQPAARAGPTFQIPISSG